MSSAFPGFVGRAFFHGTKHVLRDAERLHTSRNAGIDRQVYQRVAYLIDRDPVTERATQVKGQLSASTKRPDDYDIEKTAIAATKRFAAPICTPAELSDKVLEIPAEFASPVVGPLDVIVSYNLLADL
jgi:hypothetical protein